LYVQGFFEFLSSSHKRTVTKGLSNIKISRKVIKPNLEALPKLRGAAYAEMIQGRG
jgi:hypothetical protein